jgi:hypothetical protein
MAFISLPRVHQRGFHDQDHCQSDRALRPWRRDVAASSNQPGAGAAVPARLQRPRRNSRLRLSDRRLEGAPETARRPLTGSTKWVEYEGTSKTHKIPGSDANWEEFKVDAAKEDLHKRGQTLRLYNPASHQWNIYLVDTAKGTLGLPPTVGGFVDGRIELFDYEDWKGRWIFVRYVWTPVSPTKAHFEQSFSTDGGKTWEANWILDLTREGP